MIAGIIIAEDSTVVIRALGPTLSGAPLNVAGTISDPVLTIKDASDNTIASNDNYADTGVNAAPGYYTSINAKEPAIQLTLSASNNTAIVSGAGDTTGNALVEVYYIKV
jgi:hypothetical protein